MTPAAALAAPTKPLLLGADDPPAFRVEHPAGAAAVVLVCDHAGRAIPRQLGGLGLSARDLSTHVACDLGVTELGRALAARLDACVILHNYSRLVIDPNRPPGAGDFIPTLSERTRIAANEALPADAVRARVVELFHPYHERIRVELDERRTRAVPAVLVALHTFTPVYLDEARPWHVGVLYGRDARLGRLVLQELRAEGALVVGDNQPYAMTDATDHTLVVHGEQRGIPHVGIEVRQDLLGSPSAVARWAERLERVLEEAMSRLAPQVEAAPSGRASGEPL